MENKSYWDPAGEEITTESFTKSKKASYDSLNYYKENSTKLKWQYRLFILLGIIVTCGGIFLLLSLGKGGRLIIGIIFLSWVPLIILIAKIKDLQIDLIMILVAQTYGWVYSPDENYNRWQILAERYPETLSIGDHSQFVENEMWGVYPIGRQKVSFWKSTFVYDKGQGKSQRTYSNTVIGFKLEKRLSTRLELTRENVFSAMPGFSKDLQTESTEFNKLFHIQYQQEPGAKLEVVKILSPAVQTRLIELLGIYNIQSVLFCEDIVLLRLDKDILHTRHTNFIKKVELDLRDKDIVEGELLALAQIPVDTVKYLD